MMEFYYIYCCPHIDWFFFSISQKDGDKSHKLNRPASIFFPFCHFGHQFCSWKCIDACENRERKKKQLTKFEQFNFYLNQFPKLVSNLMEKPITHIAIKRFFPNLCIELYFDLKSWLAGKSSIFLPLRTNVNPSHVVLDTLCECVCFKMVGEGDCELNDL